MPIDITVAAGSALGPGEIQFYEAIQPPLASGQYRLSATQTIQLKDETPSYALDQLFSIAGPRFRLPTGEIQQVYPPANFTGNYEDALPHVVLRPRTLPWSRTIDGSIPANATVPPPWLCLLSLHQADRRIGAQEVLVRQTTVADLLTPVADVAIPAIDPARLSPEERAEPLLALELSQAAFYAMAPTFEELPFLVHARQVNTGGKEILGLVEDGYFSMVVGNRLPEPGAENMAVLVSLEGHRDHLPVDGQAAPAGAEGRRIRLVVLATWNYTARPARGDFLEIMEDLEHRGRVELMQLPHDAFDPADTATATLAARRALDWGYVPLFNNTRSGEATTSWYRSPAVPVHCAPDPHGPYLYSDHAIRFDPESAGREPGTALFDLTYAAAWQIGRLLALSDASFAAALFRWRQAQHNAQNVEQATADLRERLPGEPGVESVESAALGATPSEAGRHAVAAFLHGATSALTGTEFPRRVLHEHRAVHELPGVVEAALVEELVRRPGDPLYHLIRDTLGRVPHRQAAAFPADA